MLKRWNRVMPQTNGLSIVLGVLLLSSLACNFGNQPTEIPTIQLQPTNVIATVKPVETALPILTATSGQAVAIPTIAPNSAPPAAVSCPNPSGKTDSLFPTNVTSATVTNALSPRAADTWIIHGLMGQTLSLQLASSTGKAYLIISGVNRTLLLSGDTLSTRFSGSLPLTQDYYIVVNSNSLNCGNYTLTASLTR